VAAVHLDSLDVGPQAGLPVHDAVALRVDRGDRHRGVRRQVPQEALLDAGGPRVAEEVDGLRDPDARQRERVEVEGVAEGRAQGHHALNHLGVAVGEDLGQDPAPAVADQRDPHPHPGIQVHQPKGEAFQHDLGVADVEGDARQLGVVVHTVQPVVHD